MAKSKENGQDVTVIALEADCLNRRTVQEIKQSLCPLVRPNARVVLDLARVCQVDSAGVGAVLSFHRQMSAVGGNVKLSSIPQPVRSLFQRMRMHWVFDIYNGRDEAVESFQP